MRAICRRRRVAVGPDPVNTEELLQTWREATKAAELAERLALAAVRAAERAEADRTAAEEVANLAEAAAASAQRAAEAARSAALRAQAAAERLRTVEVTDADSALEASQLAEADARDRYHEAEREARERWSDDEDDVAHPSRRRETPA